MKTILEFVYQVGVCAVVGFGFMTLVGLGISKLTKGGFR